MNEGKKMGRPSDDPKQLSTRIRLSETDVQRLEFCSQKMGKTKAEIIRMGIEKMYDQYNLKKLDEGRETTRQGFEHYLSHSDYELDSIELIEEALVTLEAEFKYISPEDLYKFSRPLAIAYLALCVAQERL